MSSWTQLLAGLVLFAAGSAAGFAWWFSPPRLHPEAARFGDIAESRQMLAGNFRSYDSVEKITAALEKAGLSWKRHTIRRPPSPDYPPRAMDTLAVAEYVHLGESGSLTLEFFNDRLFEALFEPKDPEAYARKLHLRHPELRRDRNGRAETIAGDYRFATNTDFASSFVGLSLAAKPYAIWQDLRLVRERDEWDAKFGGIPYAAE